MTDLLDAAEVMKRFGYRDRKSFWLFIHRHKVPHVKFNARVIRFEAGPLEDWIAARRRGVQSGRAVQLPRGLRDSVGG
jgi:hypothetical protein